MNSMLMLVRREFWEHRSLWIAPLVFVGVLLLASAWGTIVTGGNHHQITSAATVDDIHGMSEHERADLQGAIDLPAERKQTIQAVAIVGLTGVIGAFTCIVVFFYLIDCLYSERRDRSILFWKSLPVSDTQVVLSKLLVGMLVIPLGVILLAWLTQCLMTVIMWIRFHGTVIGNMIPAFSFVAWAKAEAAALSIVFGGVLWYAPIAGYLLVMSAWARRNVFLWVILPPIALPILEYWMLGSTNVAHFLGRRFGGFIKEMNLDPNVFKHQPGNVQMPRVDDVFDALSVSGMFTHPEMWIGLLCAAILVALTIRLRRYRDDT
jgi:ABC-2 type transport system permease protein